MWDRLAPVRVQAELAQMRRIGLNTCRSFVFLPSFMPRPGALDQGALARLRQFFDLCQAEQMTTLPSLLVGHMSGENFDFVGQQGRSLCTDAQDPEIYARQTSCACVVIAPQLGAGSIAAMRSRQTTSTRLRSSRTWTAIAESSSRVIAYFGS